MSDAKVVGFFRVVGIHSTCVFAAVTGIDYYGAEIPSIGNVAGAQNGVD